MEMSDLTKVERRARTLLLIMDNLDDFLSARQELLAHIRRGGAYNVFMKGRGYDSETWETITKTLKSAGVLSA